MGLNTFNRNYGMTSTAREYWGGDNGFVTIVIDLPADVEVGTTKVTSDGSDVQNEALQTAITNAQYNQFVISQLLQQRAVLVTTSVLALDTDVDTTNLAVVDANVVAYGEAEGLTPGGKPAGGAGSVALTFIIERQDVFEEQLVRPGAAYQVPVRPAVDLATSLGGAGVFRTKDFVDTQDTWNIGNADASKAVAIKVRAALPVQL